MDPAPFDIGESVVDREQGDDPNTAIIVNCPPTTADEWTAYRDTTVAEDNPDYPQDAPVAVVVYRDELAEFDAEWADRDTPFSLTNLNEADVSHYSFPAPRLRSVEQSETDSQQEAQSKESEQDIQSDEPVDEKPSTDSADRATARTNENPAPDGERKTDSQSDSESESNPSATLVSLKEALADRGMSAEIDAENETVTAEKLGVTYRVSPDGIIEGDGPHREQIEQIAAEI